jgi:hypothetical protein
MDAGALILTRNVLNTWAAQQWHEPDLLLAALVASGLCPALGAFAIELAAFRYSGIRSRKPGQNMIDTQEQVRVHVHWTMKVISIVEIIVFPVLTYDSWQRGLAIMSVIFVLFTLLAIWVFFLADTKIDVDRQGIRLTAPHGVYAMNWAEVKSVEVKGQTAYFFGDNKVVAYNLLLAGKGKRELKKYVARVIQERQFANGRPIGITNSKLRRMLQNTKVRGWKLF